MPDLLKRPTGDVGHIHAITPKCARWSYVGFDIYRLKPGDRVDQSTRDRENILVLVEGKVELTAGEKNFGEMGDRMDVFERTPPHCLYVPADSAWQALATTACTLAVCSAPGGGSHVAQVIGPVGIETVPRGKGANTRYINNIAMEDRDVAHSLLVTEVFTPQGNWSSYPSHRHDEDNFPEITYLEETYYHRLDPKQGFGIQRVYTEDANLDECMAVRDGDVVLVPKGHHPCTAAYGYDMYYLNVMAGPLRKWRFKNDPDHAWIAERDKNGSEPNR